MREWIVTGNWKMHNTIAAFNRVSKSNQGRTTTIKNGEVVLAPPFTALLSVGENY